MMIMIFNSMGQKLILSREKQRKTLKILRGEVG
jgi:hypothetical protein